MGNVYVFPNAEKQRAARTERLIDDAISGCKPEIAEELKRYVLDLLYLLDTEINCPIKLMRDATEHDVEAIRAGMDTLIHYIGEQQQAKLIELTLKKKAELMSHQTIN